VIGQAKMGLSLGEVLGDMEGVGDGTAPAGQNLLNGRISPVYSFTSTYIV
jgi:hypothetical protein